MISVAFRMSIPFVLLWLGYSIWNSDQVQDRVTVARQEFQSVSVAIENLESGRFLGMR